MNLQRHIIYRIVVDREDFHQVPRELMLVGELDDTLAWKYIEQEVAKFGDVPTEEKFRLSYPEVSYIFPRVEESLPSLLDLANKQYQRIKTGELMGKSVTLAEKDRYDEIPALWKDASLNVYQQELFEYKSFDQLDDTPFSYRIPGFLPVNCNVMFSAQYKAGKTSTALNLSKAFTTHDDFLGEYPCMTVDGRLVYVNFELDEVMLRHYLKEAKLDAENKKMLTLNLRGKAGQFKILSDAFVESWASELKKNDCEVLIIDPLSPIMAVNGYDSDDNDGARRVLENFGGVQALAGIDHLIIVDHTGHNNSDRARGASAKGDWPDVIWNQQTNGSETSRTFSAVGRGVDYKKITITRNETGQIETTEQVADDKLVLALTENPGSTITELAKRTGINRKKVERDLLKMRVTSTGTGSAHDPRRYTLEF